MTEQQYAIARAKAGVWMGPAAPQRFYLGRGLPDSVPANPTAIYITELTDGRCAYVGKTRQGAYKRIGQHVRSWDRASRWRWLWVVPILDEVPDIELGRIEGRIGGMLDPLDTRRLPRPY